jgi:hypothetical protein
MLLLLSCLLFRIPFSFLVCDNHRFYYVVQALFLVFVTLCNTLCYVSLAVCYNCIIHTSMQSFDAHKQSWECRSKLHYSHSHLDFMSNHRETFANFSSC